MQSKIRFDLESKFREFLISECLSYFSNCLNRKLNYFRKRLRNPYVTHSDVCFQSISDSVSLKGVGRFYGAADPTGETRVHGQVEGKNCFI